MGLRMQDGDLRIREMRNVTVKRLQGMKSLFFFLTFFTFLTFSPFLTFALNETHLNRSNAPQGCNSCHKGHGKRGTLMLDVPKEELCFKCHGPQKKGMNEEAKSDMYSVFMKRSNHPVIQTAQYHVSGETLPEKSPSTRRHVSCDDCHNVHLSTKDKAIRGTRGYSRKALVKDVQRAYEVCYLCHSDSANLPPNAYNVALKFDPTSTSFHPIETHGKNRRVPSLKSPWSTGSTIDCSDCHGNDDRMGPKGPHGSKYLHLLKANYTVESGPESFFAYDLCYECHKRESILNDESFALHKRHVVYAAVSCSACHDPHGSRDYDNLISFDVKIVYPNSIGQLNYMKFLPGKPRCFLSCHTGATKYDHIMKGAQYCIDKNCPPGW